jgi:hypothetical protein
MPFWRLCLLCFVALLLTCSCSSERDTLAQAQASIAAGDLERAEVLLAPLEASRARELEAEIAKLREKRTALAGQIDALFARSAEISQNEVRDQLKRWRERATDRGAREMLEVALSEATERYTKAAAEGGKRAVATPASNGASADLGPQLRSEVREALAENQWQRADALLLMLSDQPREKVGDLSELRRAVREGALAEAQRLVAQAHQIEKDVSAREAHAWLRKHSERFPPSRDFERLTTLVDDLDERARNYTAPSDEPFTLFELADEAAEDGERALAEENAAAMGAGVLGTVAEPPDLDANGLIELARERAQKGELAFARRCALVASGKLFAGDARDDCVGLAQDLRARIALRDELQAAVKRDPTKFAGVGVTAIDAATWSVNGETRAWSELGFELLQSAASSVELSQLARRGVIAEALAADERQREAAALELARLVERGTLDAETASGMISRARGGIGAAQRYVLSNGGWASPEAVAQSEAAAIDADLERRFLRANAVERERAFEALVDGASLDTVRGALATRAVASVTKLARSKTVEQLRAVASLREAVDAARKEALELIFDEETYFYPYNPPEPPKTASDYARAQRRVNEAVDKLREAWSASKSVKLPKDFLAAFDEFEWCRATHERLQLPFAVPESLPAWLPAIPRGMDAIDVPQFAWNLEEAKDLARSRAVDARNERLWAELERQKDAVPAQVPDIAEREQVRITNRYRAMFGRRTVAWNPQIQAAAQWHSDYMANTGDFGHFEKDAERRTPSDRARKEGYNSGVSENCAMVGGDPEAAHLGWTQSSGHHRNLLMASHREMASGLASNYWTQNFGADRAFERELDQ